MTDSAPAAPLGAPVGAPLSWGNRYLMVRPDHFRIEYVINPYMSLADQPDDGAAMAQWEGLRHAILDAGGEVEVLGQREDSPDMVFAMNLGLAVDRPCREVMLSHMRFVPRRQEAHTARPWFTANGFDVRVPGADGVGPCFEAGDAFAYADCLLVGYGKRTEADALKLVANELGVRVRGVRIIDEAMYHLDLPFCPIGPRTAMAYLPAFDPGSAAVVRSLTDDLIELTAEEALTFSGNSIVVGTTIVMPACSDRLRCELESRGLQVVLVDVSEFHKAGGSVRCLTNPLDVDLSAAAVPGGQVVLPD